MNGSREEISFSQSQIVWNYIFLIVLFVVIILNNSLVLTTVLTQKRLQTQINIIVLASLSTAQLIGGLLSIPVNIVLVNDYNTGAGLKFARVVTTFCGAATQLHFTLLCVDRCIALLDPIKYSQLKREAIAIATATTWLLAILGSALSVVDFNNYSIFIVVLYHIIPLLIDVTGYGFIYHSLSAMGRENQTTLLRKEVRVTKYFAAMMFIFTLFWIPYITTVILSDHCESCDIPSSHMFLFVLYCQMLSLCFSSLIYYNGSLDFRLALKTTWKECGSFCRPGHDHHRGVTAETPSPSNRDRNANASKQDATTRGTSCTNLALFLNGGDEEHAQISPAVYQTPSPHNTSPKVPELRKTGDEVHIVPFDQSRFFREAEKGEFVNNVDLKDEDEDLYENEVESSVGFHEIDIVPYDQSC